MPFLVDLCNFCIQLQEVKKPLRRREPTSGLVSQTYYSVTFGRDVLKQAVECKYLSEALETFYHH